MPPLTVAPLLEAHLPDAAALVARRYAELRRLTPQLPPCYENPAEFLPRLQDMAVRAPGVVALEGGRLRGLLCGYLLDNFRGRPCAFSPEWANAAEPVESRRIYELLYAALCREWVADGRSLHVVSLFADDPAASEAWRWLGFGLTAADAVRDLTPLAAGAPGLRIARAGPADLPQLAGLDDGLVTHLRAAPVCLPLAPQAGRKELALELGDPSFAFWTAWDGDEAVGFVKFGPATEHACAVIVDPGTTSITAAFILPAYRSRGVGAALLSQGLLWAREAGYTRCSVDFEPMNTPAVRFWLRHFRLVCTAHVRLLYDTYVV